MSNFVYKIPKDASYVTLRNQNRMLYANYQIQQTNVQQGCQIRVALENGGVADADIIPKLLEGARATTVAERVKPVLLPLLLLLLHPLQGDPWPLVQSLQVEDPK